MNLLPYSIEKKFLSHDYRHNAFYFNYFTANKETYQKMVSRWKGRKKELISILDDIMANNLKWHEREMLNNQKNLSGIEFKRLHVKKRMFTLDYTNLEYCLFEFCKFDDSEYEDHSDTDVHEDHLESIFTSSKLNHAMFKSCKFEDIAFGSGEFNNIVFYNCTFDHVVFNRNMDGNYNALFFQNCHFHNTDFSKLKMDNSCFWGDCSFEKVVYDDITLSKKRIIGLNIIQQCKTWDMNSFSQRKEYNYIGGPLNKVEIFAKEATVTQNKVRRFSSTINCYEGLLHFYKYLAKTEDHEGEHQTYMSFYYFKRWITDEVLKLKNGRIKNIRAFISRYFLGYGVKAERSLFVFAGFLILFSLVFLFSGVSYQGSVIDRDLQFAPEEFGATLKDYKNCLYYSIITSTTVGYGDVVPIGGSSKFFAAAAGFIGTILLTIFTVILGRRYIE